MNLLSNRVRRQVTGLLLSLALGTCVVEAQSPVVQKNPGAAGLWIGEVTLNAVTHAAGNTNAPTVDKAQLRILLHVAADGTVRLLKDVTAARKNVSGGTPPPPPPPGQPVVPSDPFAATSVILVTNPTLLPGLTGVIRRNGKLVGQRFATAAYDFPGNELLMAGGLGQGFACKGTNVVSADSATNPFRHKFHPAHGTGIQVTREISMRFTRAMSNVNGADQLNGDYEETVTGLHRVALKTQGTVQLNRLSPVDVLNQ